MKRILSAALLVVFLIGAYFFIQIWRGTASWGVGTGEIAKRETGGRGGQSGAATRSSVLRQVVENPQKYAGQRVTVSGRVRGNTKYASNRNLYRINEGEHSLLVVDDKSAPKEYWPRTVSGTVKVLKSPVGQGYPYVVSVKGDPNIDLKWTDVKSFFGDKYRDVKKGVKSATN